MLVLNLGAQSLIPAISRPGPFLDRGGDGGLTW
jgi:hypothetical protein